VDTETVTIRSSGGTTIEAELVETCPNGSLRLRTRDDRWLYVPTHVVERRTGRELYLAANLEALREDAAVGAEDAAVGASYWIEGGPAGDEHEPQRTVPVVAEEIVVQKRPRTTAVRVHTTTRERDETVEEVLTREAVEVERVVVDRFVDGPEVVRTEGDVTIVPLHEEVLVVEKRLVVREEVHIRTRAEPREVREHVRLRSQEAEVERSDDER
jgi:stress response protein YsnF